MKVKKCFWRPIRYGDTKEFKFWSLQIIGEGDKTQRKGSSPEDWKKVIILNPTGHLASAFSIGFIDLRGNAKISNIQRRIDKGSFGMRLGPENCYFFIASHVGKIKLEFVEYADINDKSKANLTLY